MKDSCKCHTEIAHERQDFFLKSLALSGTVCKADQVAHIRENCIGNSLDDQLFELPGVKLQSAVLSFLTVSASKIAVKVSSPLARGTGAGWKWL